MKSIRQLAKMSDKIEITDEFYWRNKTVLDPVFLPRLDEGGGLKSL
jgi:hypothetical protein